MLCPVQNQTLAISSRRSCEGEELGRGTGLDVAMESGRDCGRRTKKNEWTGFIEIPVTAATLFRE